jgi:hypothetical protein
LGVFGLTLPANSGDDISLFINGWGITQGAWGVQSDRRIKQHIAPVSSMLDIIHRIEVVSYEKISNVQISKEECSVVAQQIQEVFPNAVTSQTDFVPNIRHTATFTITDIVTIHVPLVMNNDTKKDIMVGKRIKLFVIGTNNEEKEVITTLLSVDFEGTLTVPLLENISFDDKLFVYGTEVDDFLAVDKSKLGIMALQGVKEVDTKVEALEKKNQVLEQKNKALEQKVSDLEQMLSMLQQQFNTFVSHMA